MPFPCIRNRNWRGNTRESEREREREREMIQLPSGKFSLAKHHRAANWLKNIDNFTSHPNLEGKACPQNGTCRIYLFAFIREKVDGDVEGEMWCSDESGTAKK